MYPGSYNNKLIPSIEYLIKNIGRFCNHMHGPARFSAVIGQQEMMDVKEGAPSPG
jgi:hypothetical protein